MAKVFTITVPPDMSRKKRERTADPRYVAVELLSEHVRTRFRMTDSPLS